MTNFFRRLSRLDWISLGLSVAFVLLTILPMTPLVSLGEAWHTALLISAAAVTLSTIVVAQIYARESDRTLNSDVSSLESLVRTSLTPDGVREVQSNEIREELDRMLSNCNEWYFRGGSARWQREAVLPRLARITDRPVDYKVQIISPFEAELCEKYASYRRKSQPGDPRGDAKQISIELLAFIFATSVWQSRSKIAPEITLLHRFSPFRLDGDSSSFMITVADTKKNGLRTSAGNWYHASLLDEFAFEAGYATRLELPTEASDTDGPAGVKAFFEEVRSLNPEATSTWAADYDDTEWDTILRIGGTTNATI